MDACGLFIHILQVFFASLGANGNRLIGPVPEMWLWQIKSKYISNGSYKTQSTEKKHERVHGFVLHKQYTWHLPPQ